LLLSHTYTNSSYVVAMSVIGAPICHCCLISTNGLIHDQSSRALLLMGRTLGSMFSAWARPSRLEGHDKNQQNGSSEGFAHAGVKTRHATLCFFSFAGGSETTGGRKNSAPLAGCLACGGGLWLLRAHATCCPASTFFDRVCSAPV
jgi:hypothetical protein